MILKILEYDKLRDIHICDDENGKRHRVDLMVDGRFKGVDPMALVGQVAEVDYLHPYEEIASNVKLINPRKDGGE